jgi:type I restriction enzyme S subunit
MIDFAVKPGDLIISCSGTMGKIAIIPDNIKPGIINQALLRLSPHKNIISSEYLRLILETEETQNKHFRSSLGVAIQNVASVKTLKSINIPLPKLDIQNHVVMGIKKERILVDSCNELINRYEQKIKNKVAEVWGV